MGIFSQDKTSTQQTSINQNVGVSNRDVGGGQTTGAGGAITAGQGSVAGGPGSITSGLLALGSGSATRDITIQSLDATALNTAAATINHAIDTNAQFAQNVIGGFQNSNSVGSEAPLPANPITGNSGGGLSSTVSPNGVLSGIEAVTGLSPVVVDLIVGGLVLAVAAVLFIGYKKSH